MRAAAITGCIALLSLLAFVDPAKPTHNYSTRATYDYGVVEVGGHTPDYWRSLALRRTRQLRATRRENKAHRRAFRERQVWNGAHYALRLAAAIYPVPFGALHSVARCESGLWPYAQNGRYRGLFQEGPMFEAGPFGRAGFSVWDPIANALTAAFTVWRQGWRQWACKP